jgi:hypothetical protein
MEAMTLGRERSKMGITTRKRDHDSQAQNNTVAIPATTGPSPKSYWNHIPGSGTHGR